MANSQNDSTINPSDFHSFSAYIRALVATQLQREPSVKSTTDAADVNFFAQLNHYLSAEGQPPLLLPEGGQMPQQLESVLRNALHYKQVMQLDHPFTAQDDVNKRAHNQQHQANLAELYYALFEYRKAKDLNFRPEKEQLKLWKNVFEKQPSGDVARCEEPAGEINFDDRVVIIAPGMSTLHQTKDALASYFKQVELMLGGNRIYDVENPQKIQLYAFTYPYLGVSAQKADVFATNATPYTHISPMVQQWVDETLLPSLGLCAEHLLSDEALQASLTRLRFYSISYGSVIVEQIRNALSKSLMAQGYSASQLAAALPKVFVLKNNPLNRLAQEIPETGAFQTVNAVSSQDVVAEAYADYGAFVRAAQARGETVKARRINPHSWLYWDDSPVSGINVDKIEAGEGAEWQIPRGHLTQHGHHSELTAHDVLEPLKHGASRFHSAAPLQNLLRWAVSGKEMPDDIRQAFAPCYLVTPSPREEQLTRVRTEMALSRAQRT